MSEATLADKILVVVIGLVTLAGAILIPAATIVVAVLFLRACT